MADYGKHTEAVALAVVDESIAYLRELADRLEQREPLATNAIREALFDSKAAVLFEAAPEMSAQGMEAFATPQVLIRTVVMALNRIAHRQKAEVADG